MIRRPKLGYQKNREKKTSPRAKLQTSGFVFKRTGRRYQNVLGMEQEKGKRRAERAALHGIHISFLEINDLI